MKLFITSSLSLQSSENLVPFTMDVCSLLCAFCHQLSTFVSHASLFSSNCHLKWNISMFLHILIYFKKCCVPSDPFSVIYNHML
jgi:hypothetical protein